MANVIASPPPSESLYSALPQQPCALARSMKSLPLAQEIVHYRLVRKRYKRAKMFVNWAAVVSVSLSGLASIAGLALALSDIGIPEAVPLGVVGGFFSVASSFLIVVGKKLDKKMSKH